MEKDYILLLGLIFYIRNIILLGLTTKKHYSNYNVGDIGTPWGNII